MKASLIVAGGRNFEDFSLAESVLEAAVQLFRFKGFEVVNLFHGGARGADKLAGKWAETFHPEIEVNVVEADWKKYRKSAGYRRNAEMVSRFCAQEGIVKLGIIFPGGNGTKNTHSLLTQRNVNVFKEPFSQLLFAATGKYQATTTTRMTEISEQTEVLADFTTDYGILISEGSDPMDFVGNLHHYTLNRKLT